MSYTQSIFTQATLKVMDDREALKKEANKAKAAKFLHETGVPSPVRKKRISEMTEFERLMEAQANGSN